jgi:selenide,water dikinase
LSDALQGLEPPTDPDLLVGFETADDAAVYRVSDEVAVISTVDFITPPVDDPYWFGQIAAANSLSDVYSMGGVPRTAMNLVMFPAGDLDMGVLREILRGGHDKVVEAGASLVGGHSVEDDEPKYGLSVNGTVHPDRIITNAGARPGDALVLTKPLGTGVLFNACVSGRLDERDLVREVLPTVAALNGPAMKTALDFDLHACTDITGFGIAGHAYEMAAGAAVSVRLDFSALPVYPWALEMYRKGETTGSNQDNRALVASSMRIRASLSREQNEILVDPQTSGGLLLALPEADAGDLVEQLHAAGVASATRVGSVVEGPASLEIH